jgi:hypothetical protein
MKKIKFLVLAGVVATSMMGAGYAAWTDTTVLSSTVRTGNFNMEITAATTRTGDDQTKNEAHDWHQYDWTHSNSVTHTATKATVDLKDIYPGGLVQVDMTTVNNGTIPAKLKSVDLKFLGGNRAVFNALKAQTSWKADINGDGAQDDYEHVDGWKSYKPLGEALTDLVASTTANNLVIEPKGSFSLGDGEEPGCITIKLDKNAGNELQNQYCQFEITFNWEQWTTNPNDNPYNAADKQPGLSGYGGDGDVQ